MPLITDSVPTPACAVTAIVAASPGWSVEASAPPNTGTADLPVPSSVVAWAQIADPDSAGGVRVDPVFLAGGRAWTPDQYRAAYGASLGLQVVRTR